MSEKCHSIRSRTSPTSSPTKTPLFRPRTAIRLIRSYGWTCGQSPSSCQSRRWNRSATTRSCSATAIPTTKGATPAGIKKVFRSSTQLSVAGYRTQLFNPDDLDGVKKVQAGYKVQTLSAYLKQPATTAAAAIDFPKIDKQLVKTNFFEYLDFADMEANWLPAPNGTIYLAARHKASRIERHRERSPAGTSIALDNLIASARG